MDKSTIDKLNRQSHCINTSYWDDLFKVIEKHIDLLDDDVQSFVDACMQDFSAQRKWIFNGTLEKYEHLNDLKDLYNNDPFGFVDKTKYPTEEKFQLACMTHPDTCMFGEYTDEIDKYVFFEDVMTLLGIDDVADELQDMSNSL